MKYKSKIASTEFYSRGLFRKMSNGYAQEEFNSKPKIVPAKEKPVKPK
jgi:hypothetical protein